VVPVSAGASPWNTPLREAGQVAKAPPSNTPQREEALVCNNHIFRRPLIEPIICEIDPHEPWKLAGKKNKEFAFGIEKPAKHQIFFFDDSATSP